MSKILGIDLGTTSVKVILLDPSTNKVEHEASAETKASLQLPEPLKNEQDVHKIFSCLDAVLASFPKELMQKVAYIGISGQMHGILFWQTKTWDFNNEKEIFSIDEDAVSTLITWQDSRCTPEFLATLPTPNSHLAVHTGYGIPTLCWLKQFDPKQLQRYQNSGTIHDFLVAVLTNNTKKALMTPQNASSWGYFNSATKTWNFDELINYPVDLLPEIVDAGSVAGSLCTSWHGIPKGCKIGAALGDSQASIYSTLFDKPEGSAVLNISTSAQLSFIIPGDEFSSKLKEIKGPGSGAEIFEYFDGCYIMGAAALTGGNCLVTFVQMLQSWVKDLGLEIDQDTIWSKILASDDEAYLTDLVVTPTFLGERNCPKKRASVSNIHGGNIRLRQLTHSICRGIITNIAELMPQQILLQNKIHTIYGTGSAFLRNKILQDELQRNFSQVKVEVCKYGSDSAVGAAVMGKRWINF